MSNAEVFNGGVSTDPDILKLKDTFGAPEEGTVISHEDISNVIAEPPSTDRYRTVVGRWKNTLLREHNIELLNVRGHGYKVGIPAERVQEAMRKVGLGNRQIRRAGVRAMLIDRSRLTDEEKRVQDHCVGFRAALDSLTRTAPKKLNVSGAVGKGEANDQS